jgi:hypothetical protein
MLWWLIICTKKTIQDEDVQIHHHLCEYENFALHVASRVQPGSTTPEVDEDILDVVIETLGIST